MAIKFYQSYSDYLIQKREDRYVNRYQNNELNFVLASIPSKTAFYYISSEINDPGESYYIIKDNDKKPYRLLYCKEGTPLNFKHAVPLNLGICNMLNASGELTPQRLDSKESFSLKDKIYVKLRSSYYFHPSVMIKLTEERCKLHPKNQDNLDKLKDKIFNDQYDKCGIFFTKPQSFIAPFKSKYDVLNTVSGIFYDPIEHLFNILVYEMGVFDMHINENILPNMPSAYEPLKLYNPLFWIGKIIEIAISLAIFSIMIAIHLATHVVLTCLTMAKSTVGLITKGAATVAASVFDPDSLIEYEDPVNFSLS